jgi:hypothetical protein
MPFCSALANSSSVQPPIPVATSGVMFGASSVPNGVSRAPPPAYGLPPGRRMAGGAIGSRRHVAPALDELERLLVRVLRARRSASQKQRTGEEDVSHDFGSARNKPHFVTPAHGSALCAARGQAPAGVHPAAARALRNM